MSTTATERLQAIVDWADLALSRPEEFDSHGVKNLDGPVFDDARAYLASAAQEADAAPDLLASLRYTTQALVAMTSLVISSERDKCRPSKSMPSEAMFEQMLRDFDRTTAAAREAIAKADGLSPKEPHP